MCLFAEKASQLEEGITGVLKETLMGAGFDAVRTGVDSGYKGEYVPVGVFKEVQDASEIAANKQNPLVGETKWAQDKGEELGGSTTKEIIKLHIN